MKKITHTAIIGGGISGLSIAHAIKQNKKSVRIIESQSKVGGSLQSHLKDGYLAELGPNSLLVKDRRVEELLYEIGLDESSDERIIARPEAKKRYIVQDGKPIAMPSSPIGMIQTPLFSFKGKLRFALEPFIGKYRGRERGEGEESFAAFVRRRLGPDMLASAAGPFVSGIYAGDPENLSVRHAFPRLWNLENHYGSFILGAIALQFGWGKGGKNPHRLSPAKMISFRDGMHTLPEKIAHSLDSSSLSTSCEISDIQLVTMPEKAWKITWTDVTNETSHSELYQNLVIAVPHLQLEKLPFPANISNLLTPLKELKSPPVTSLVLGFNRAEISHPLDGFGMLIKQSENSPLLGVLFSSSMFDHRAPNDHVTLTCMMGGTLHPEYASNTDEVVIKELQKLLGLSQKAKPTFIHRKSWNHAIPQYDLHYQKILDTLEDCEKKHPNLYFIGNYRGGISVGDCIVNALEFGKKISQ